MREALSNVLAQSEDAAEIGVDRVLATAFFRKRPMQAGASACVVILADRRAARGEGVFGLMGSAEFPRSKGRR